MEEFTQRQINIEPASNTLTSAGHAYCPYEENEERRRAHSCVPDPFGVRNLKRRHARGAGRRQKTRASSSGGGRVKIPAAFEAHALQRYRSLRWECLKVAAIKNFTTWQVNCI